VSGRKFAAALATIALLAFVLPPIAAHQVHQGRIDRAREAVVRLATAFGAETAAALAEVVGPPGREPFVLAGPGAGPEFAPGLGWPAGRVLSLSAVAQRLSTRPAGASIAATDVQPDPWGNQYLVVIGVGIARSVTVLSAGPNGTVETGFGSALSPKGDDIVAVR
jgi:hypothetical protein